MRTLAERRDGNEITVNLKQLAGALGLSHGTVRNLMSRLVATDSIRTTQVRNGDTHGVLVRFTPRFEALLKADSPLGYQGASGGIETSASIWDADETLINELWPYAAQAGLEPAHLQQLSRVFHIQGWTADAVALSLRSFDWALRAGEAISLVQWLEQMRRQGSFPKL